MITNIDVTRILPHPNNPRKDLGDLTELAESIKINGILQNLTVVPADIELYQKKIASKKAYTGDFIAVIGHRRHAAAKLAGFTDVPCTITDMDEKKQVATMLLENIQRSDLTVYEQAQGFQMMLDFGDTVIDISQKTGFSESTVRRRVKLMELDAEKFKDSVERGATLQDYTELEKIKDIKLRNNVLENIGTSNFKWTLKNAIDKEKSEENKAALIDKIKKFAEQVETADGLSGVQYISFYNITDFDKPDDADTVQYYFLISQYNIQLLKKADESDIDNKADEAEERQRMQELRLQLDDITKRAYLLRRDFIKNFSGGKKYTQKIMEFATFAFIHSGWSEYQDELFAELLGVEFDDDDGLLIDEVSEAFAATPERVLLISAYCNSTDSEKLNYYEYRTCKHSANENLDTLYGHLEKLGYEISDEEQAMRDGSHKFLIRNESDEADNE